MQLAIKNKWITLRGSSIVQDLDGNNVMKVRGKFFTFTRKKFVQDLDEKTHYIVRNKFWVFFVKKAFVMDENENIIVRIRRKFFSVHDRYFVESTLGQMEIVGNILGFDYHIKLDGVEIGHISRKISLRDSFVLDINDKYDPMLFVALVIAIDNITDQRRDESNSFSYSSN